MNKALRFITFSITMHRMPTKNPRLTITLQPSLAAQLRRLSELTGNSQSALIADLLSGSGPVFDRLIQVLEAAEAAKGAMKGRITGEMEAAQSKIEGAMGIVMENFDLFTGSLLDEAEAVGRRARQGHAKAGRGGRGGTPPTPLSNRGVRFDTEEAKSTIKSKGYAVSGLAGAQTRKVAQKRARKAAP